MRRLRTLHFYIPHCVSLIRPKKLFVCPPHKLENGGRQVEGFFFVFFLLFKHSIDQRFRQRWLENLPGVRSTVILYITCKNWGIVSVIVHIKENELTAIIKFWHLKAASFVIKLKKKKSLGAGQKIGAGGGGQTNNFFCLTRLLIKCGPTWRVNFSILITCICLKD